jgi:ribosomal protein S18 acetylase RimI-like enzyme
MNHVVDDFAQRGFTHVSLWVARSNERARGFYERLGWRPDGRDDEPFFGAPQIRYRIELGA